MSALGTYRVRVGFSGGQPAGVFTLGGSTIGGPDKLGWEFQTGYEGPYDDVTDKALDFTITRGRDNPWEKIPGGTLDLHLHDKTGLFNPKNEGYLANYLTNPSFEPPAGLAGWQTYGTNKLELDFGGLFWPNPPDWCAKVTYQNDLRMASVPVSVPPHTRGIASIWVWIDSTWDGGQIQIGDDGLAGGASFVSLSNADMSKRNVWQRIWWAYDLAEDGDTGLFVRTASAATPGRFFWIDAAMVEAYPNILSPWDPGFETQIATGQGQGPTPGIGNPWWGYHSGMSQIARDTAQFHGGVASLRADITAGDTSLGISASNVPIEPGKHYRFGVWVRGVSGRNMSMTANQFEKENAVNFQEGANTLFVGTAGWTFQFVDFQAGPNSHWAYIYVITGGPAGATSFYTDDWTVTEDVRIPGDYVDGSKVTGRWEGAPHASRSYRGSPLFGHIKPLIPALVEVQIAGTWYELFHGWLDEESAKTDWGEKEANLHFVDMFTWLDRAKAIAIPQQGSTTVGAAIGLILDAIEWTNPDFRSLSVGMPITDFYAFGEKGGTDLVSDLLEVDRGTFFASRSGAATYRDRHQPYRVDPVATFEVASSVVPGVALSRIRNRARVTRLSGGVVAQGDSTGAGFGDVATTQEYFDQASVEDFGFSDWPEIRSSYFFTDTDALTLAKFLVFQGKDPVGDVWQMSTQEIDQSQFADLAQLDLQDKIEVATDAVTGDYIVEKIVHRGEGGVVHKTNLVLSEAPPFEAFIIGVSTIGSTEDVLVP